MANEFYINQIFEKEYPPESADWCNNRGDCYIDEIESINGIRRFQIVETEQPSEEEIKQIKIFNLKQKLSDTDYVAFKIAEGSATKEEYADILVQRELWREEIRSLASELQ